MSQKEVGVLRYPRMVRADDDSGQHSADNY